MMQESRVLERAGNGGCGFRRRLSGVLTGGGLAALLTALLIGTCARVSDHCSDGNALNSGTEFCYEGRAYPKCGKGSYNPQTHECLGGVLHKMCPDGPPVLPDASCSAGRGTLILTTNIYPAHSGNVKRSPDRPNYDSGTKVTVTAEPEPGYTFTGWTGDSTSAGASVTVTMNGHLALTANFKAVTYTLNATQEGCGIVSLNPQQTSYNPGAQVIVTATPVPGCEFTGWTGDETSAELHLIVTMNGNKTLTASFKRQGGGDSTIVIPETYILTTNINPAGGGAITRDLGQTSYIEGTPVTLTATQNSGYRFTGWTGDSTSAEPEITVTMTKNKTLTANFQRITYTLTTNITPAGGGTVARSPNAGEYGEGTQVSITAEPAAGYRFTGWTGADAVNPADNPATLTMNGDLTITAVFEPAYTLTTAATPATGGTVFLDPEGGTYAAGTKVTATAIPANGQKFTGWTGAANSTANPVEITMDSDQTLTAKFETATVTPTTYTLTISANPTAGGTMSPTGAIIRDAGTTVSVTATPATGYRFTGWSGASNATTATTTVTMNGNLTLTANFEQQYTLTANVNLTAGGSATRNPSKTYYNKGDTVTVTASANTGYRFTGWTGASTVTTNPVKIVMNSNQIITANFEQQYTLTVSANPTGGGTVTKNPNLTYYNNGASVTVTAVSAEGYRFVEWSGASTSGNPTVTVTMSTNRTLTANFEEGYLTDWRDGKVYRTIRIPGLPLTWMAENLNYSFVGGVVGKMIGRCYGNVDSNCVKYGRLYHSDEAINACPEGWRLPNDKDVANLISMAGGREMANQTLKSRSGWDGANMGNGTDHLYFSALPGGYCISSGHCFQIGKGAWWWYIDVTKTGVPQCWSLGDWYLSMTGEGSYNSIRCVKD